ncbi:MAG: ABC transporter ATP-binding protein [Tissierellia bacterium]|nr:ABC transporter ATP-binding protein [Tissierellia bacterium]
MKIREIFRFLGRYKKYYYAAVICTALETALQLLITLVMANIIDVGIVKKDLNYILSQGIVMIGIAILSLLLGRAAAKFNSVSGIGLGSELRMVQFSNIQKLSFSQIDKFQTGSLITRLTTDVTRIQTAFMMTTRMLIRGPIMLLIALILSTFISLPLSMVILVSIPILTIGIAFLMIKVKPIYMRMQKNMDEINMEIQENLDGIRVVKSFNRESDEIEDFEKGNAKLRDTALEAYLYLAASSPLVQILVFATTLAILWFGGKMVYMGELEIGKLTTFISYVNQIMFSMILLSIAIMQISRSLVSFNRVMEVIETENDIDESDCDQKLNIERGSIDFENVYFKYYDTSEEYVLKDINFKIGEGMKVGILGGTGSGKSTLVQLIPRLYDIDKGRILIDGIDIKKYCIDNLRKSISMVLQQNTLFSGTLAENLRLGNPEASEEDMRKACEISGALEFVDELENGFDYYVEQEGSNFSGGQKQRLCIARAILTNPKIIIFDDSTSAVDTDTEKNIQRGLEENLSGTTVITIAQRISSIENSDIILVMDNGEIKDQGSHEYLLENSDIYKDVYISQRRSS